MAARLAAVLLAAPLLAACVAASPAGGGYAPPPLGFSTYGTTPDGQRVRVWTDTLNGRTTGTVGGRSINCIAGTCRYN